MYTVDADAVRACISDLAAQSGCVRCDSCTRKRLSEDHRVARVCQRIDVARDGMAVVAIGDDPVERVSYGIYARIPNNLPAVFELPGR